MVKRYDVNGSTSCYEDENGCFVDYQDYSQLESDNLNLKKLVLEQDDKLKQIYKIIYENSKD